MLNKRHIPTGAIFSLFFISGATGLAYEIIWTRMIVRVFGATSFAVTTVLASYMAGLALGSYVFGRLIDRKGNPVRTYGLLELGIGLFAVILPALLPLANPLYKSVYPALHDDYYLLNAVRFVLCFALLLIPTILMGGTLPVLSKFVARDLRHLTSRVGTLYAVNTAGAVTGCLATGFVILPTLGIRETTWVFAALNVLIFGAALVISTRSYPTTNSSPLGGATREGIGPDDSEPAQTATERDGEVPAPQEGFTSRAHARLVLVTFMLTGFFGLALEVIWTRVLSLVIGTTVYAFAAMLATFLLGLALGSAVFARLAQRAGHPGRTLGFLTAAVGVAVCASALAFGKLPIVYMHYYETHGATWADMLWLEFLLSFGIMLLPTFLMGGVFPLIARLYARDVSRVGSEIGTIYAFNTIGAIVGAFVATFVLLRYLGVEKALVLVAAGYFVVSIVLTASISGYRSLLARAAFILALVAVGVGIFAASPRWNRKIITSGVYRYAPLYKTVDGLRDAAISRTLLFYDEGPGATVSVERNQDQLALIIDGKADASTDIVDMTTQLLLAHLPLLFHHDPDTILVIGLGGGVTLGSAARHDVSHIDCVELLDNVVEAASYFRPYNYDCLSDPRIDVMVSDARNHILSTDRTYDVIISQPPNPWISGVGDLFTLEFFDMMRSRLEPGGIICNWLHIYHMGDDDLRSAVASYLRVFPHVTLWLITETDVIMLGSEVPFEVDTRFLERMEMPLIRSDLSRIWIDEAGDILSLFVTDAQGLRAYTDGAEPHTDNNMTLEFSAAKKVFESTQNVHMSSFLGMMKPIPTVELSPEVEATLRDHLQGRRLALTGAILEAQGEAAEAVAFYDEAYAIARSNQSVLLKYALSHLAVANALMQEHEYDTALAHYRMALVGHGFPRAWAVYWGMANHALAKHDIPGAQEYLRLSLQENPYNARAHYKLGQIEQRSGALRAASESFEQAVRLAPDFADAAGELARTYLEEGVRAAEALELAMRASSLSETTDHLNAVAWAYHALGKPQAAEAWLKSVLKKDPQNPEALYRLALVQLKKGNTEEYRSLLKRLADQGKDDRYSREARSLLGPSR